MMQLTEKELKSYASPENCHISKEKIKEKDADDEEYCKVRDPCHCIGEYRGAAHSICSFKYSSPKEIPVIFYIRSNITFYHKRAERRI